MKQSLAQRAAFKAAQFPNSTIKAPYGTVVPSQRDWLFALPVASNGLHLDDEGVQLAVSLRLGLPV